MKQGPPVAFVWPLSNLLPVLLPWLAVLALLALPSNRSARAWWIWAPLVALALLGVGLEAVAAATDDEGLGYPVQTACAAAFGLAAVWLLGAVLARRCRALSIALMALAFAAPSLLSFVSSPAWEQLWESRQYNPAAVQWEPVLYLLLFWIASGLVLAAALNLTGRMCRKRFGRLRVSLLLPLWLWVMWLVALGLIGCVVALVSSGSFEWDGLLVAPVVLALVSCAVILPFLILSFASSFYGERLKHLLRLPDASSADTYLSEMKGAIEKLKGR